MDWDRLDDAAFARVEYEMALGLLQCAPIDVLAHPGGMYQRLRKRSFPDAYLRELMTVSIAAGVAIEINTSYLLDVDGFLRLCAEINPCVSIGSDAHSLEAIGQCRDILRAKRAGHA
jgi:putative hydrolase